MDSLEIIPAKDGGFLVARGTRFYRNGDMLEGPLFAGTLSLCLKYIEAHYTPKKVKGAKREG